jgi:hypothetical protein
MEKLRSLNCVNCSGVSQYLADSCEVVRRQAHVEFAPIAKMSQAIRVRLSLLMRKFRGEPKALSNAPIALKRSLIGPSGPRIKAKAVHEIVVSSLEGGRCTSGVGSSVCTSTC